MQPCPLLSLPLLAIPVCPFQYQRGKGEQAQGEKGGMMEKHISLCYRLLTDDHELWLHAGLCCNRSGCTLDIVGFLIFPDHHPACYSAYLATPLSLEVCGDDPVY